MLAAAASAPALTAASAPHAAGSKQTAGAGSLVSTGGRSSQIRARARGTAPFLRPACASARALRRTALGAAAPPRCPKALCPPARRAPASRPPRTLAALSQRGPGPGRVREGGARANCGVRNLGSYRTACPGPGTAPDSGLPVLAGMPVQPRQGGGGAARGR